MSVPRITNVFTGCFQKPQILIINEEVSVMGKIQNTTQELFINFRAEQASSHI